MTVCVSECRFQETHTDLARVNPPSTNEQKSHQTNGISMTLASPSRDAPLLPLSTLTEFEAKPELRWKALRSEGFAINLRDTVTDNGHGSCCRVAR